MSVLILFNIHVGASMPMANPAVCCFHWNTILKCVHSVAINSPGTWSPLLGSIMTTIENHKETSVRGRHKPIKRQRITSHYMHQGYHVCTKTYSFLYGIGENHWLNALKKHYVDNGVELRVHKNTKQPPSHAATYEDIVSLDISSELCWSKCNSTSREDTCL